MNTHTNSPAKRVFYHVDDFYACGWYRCHVPGLALQRKGYEVRLGDQITPADVDSSDVIVFQRKHGKTELQAITYANEHGKTTVYEVDDDIFNVHPSSPAFEFWIKPEHKQGAIECIRACDRATTTTKLLADTLRPMNRQVFVCPNMLPDEYWPFPDPKPQSADRVVIGWAGSYTHEADLKAIVPVIVQILDSHPRTEFVFAGDLAPFEAHERARKMEPVRLEQYPWLIRTFDIGLAPLLDSVFNKSKSDLKFLEYAMIGIPSIVSKVGPYIDSVDNRRTGFLAQNSKDWLRYLTALVEDPDLRFQTARRAQSWARTRLADANTAVWEKAYGLTD